MQWRQFTIRNMNPLLVSRRLQPDLRPHIGLHATLLVVIERVQHVGPHNVEIE